jgi:hypothetical protein
LPLAGDAAAEVVILRRAAMSEPLADLAYYYPQPYWRGDESDGLKNLLLFFDGIAILLPRYMAGRPAAADPVFAGSLRSGGSCGSSSRRRSWTSR